MHPFFKILLKVKNHLSQIILYTFGTVSLIFFNSKHFISRKNQKLWFHSFDTCICVRAETTFGSAIPLHLHSHFMPSYVFSLPLVSHSWTIPGMKHCDRHSEHTEGESVCPPILLSLILPWSRLQTRAQRCSMYHCLQWQNNWLSIHRQLNK